MTKPATIKKVVIQQHDVNGRTETIPEWNLVCERGHVGYSPEPMTWVGHECLCRYFNEKTGRRVTCHKKSMLMKDYKPGRIPKAIKKQKPKRKKRKVVSRF